ncbi:MAG: UDP-2,3-diacylglucosamine diphosphatase [Planctomycetota bacterium]|nr:UDP-2,3-diacylglucosamine diphosphatase [Planctomycetota bacterium]
MMKGSGPIKKAVFISDVHLKPSDRGKSEILRNFLKRINDVEVLFILGDFFDFWVGEEQLKVMDCNGLFKELHFLANNGTRVCFLRGNRDFLLNRRSVRPFGAFMSGSHIEVLLNDKKVSLSHGDNFLLNDEMYLLFRAVTRQPSLKAAFKHLLPYNIKMLFAQCKRKESSASVKRKVRHSERIVELSKRAIIEQFKSGYDVIVCGHVHKPTITHLSIKGNSHTLYTLGDWSSEKGCYLLFDNNKFSLRSFPSEEELTESSPEVPSLF